MPPKNQNPIDKEYQKELGPDFNPLAQAEQDGTASDSNGDGIKNAEENPNGWKNNVTGTGGSGRGKNTSSTAGGSSGNKAVGNNTGPFNSKISFSALRKRSPLITIILTLVGGGIGIGGLLSPGLLIVQMKEVMVNKFNSQLTSMTSRETRLYAHKMSGKLTGGVCTSPVSILCKYSTMSEKQVAKFEKAGIKVNYDKTSITGRAKPTSFEFKGEKIAAKDFSKKIIKDVEFKSSVHMAYNPKFAGFADADWVKAEAELGISKKAANLDGKTDDQKLKSVQEDTKNPAPQDSTTSERVSEGQRKPGTTGDAHENFYNADEVKAINNAIDEAAKAADEVASDAARVAENGIKAAPGALESSISTAANTIKITGWLDNACGAYGAVQAVGYAAKTVRALQLARYAMIFLNVADQIKAGTAKPEDVAYLGTVLTTQFITKDKHGKIVSKKSATDSFGYQFAAYGKGGKMSNTATQFLAGGGLTGDMINITSKIDSILGHNPKKTCKVVRNPFVSVGSLIGGVALFFVPGANIPFAAWDVAKAAAGVGLQIAIAYAPALLKDIVAGVLVDKTTVGEAAGDAITSGSSGIMSTSAKYGGNAPLTPSDAVAYNNLSTEVAAQYAQEDRLTHSPLDASNGNTFMGKIVGQLTPYLTNMSSLSGILSSVTSITTGSFASLTGQTAKAASTDDYTMCQDFDYRDMGLATDPYCNVTYGIPPEALNADPIVVAQKLIDDGQINPETGDPAAGSDYEGFVKDCIDRTSPLGDDSNGSNGSHCLFDDTNKNYYIHYIDQRVQAGLDGEDVASNTTTDSPGTTAGGTNPPSGTDRPDNVQTVGNGWVLKDGVDYSNITCAAGTTDGGTYKHPIRKFTIRKCGTSLGPVASGEVSSLISQKLVDMIAAAKQDNIDLKGSGWRSYEEQKVLWDQCAPNCNGMVAQPGNSNHEKGLAIDFTRNGWRLTTADVEHKWLDKNAAKFGFINLPIEPWHWSMSGG